jgi:hypothetical protein
MLPELERGATDAAGLTRLRASLEAGPWCWPDSLAKTAYSLAAAATGLDSPPQPKIGVLPGITVEDSCAYLWLIDGQPDTSVVGDADLGDSCRRAWDAAALALPRSVPLLWTSISAAHATTPRIRLVAARMAGSGVTPACRLVRGPSFGLSFLLVLASRVFRVSLPGDVIASAAITEDGALEGVEGLQLKIETIVSLMPRVRRLLVAAGQLEEARQWAVERLEVIGVASASQALEKVFKEGLADLLLLEGEDPDRRNEVADWFFRFSLVGRGELVDWSPVAAAARMALDNWSPLTEDQTFKLRFARGVAERHEWNGGTLPVPSVEWLLARPATLRAQIVAHLIQQVADAGQPSWSEVEPLVNLVRQPTLKDAHQMQLRVEGALARLWSIMGRPNDALRRHEELAQLYFDNLLYGEVSFPLSEWFRLSGVVGDKESFDRADEMRDAVAAVGGFGLHGSVYVELARCKALSCLAPLAEDGVLATLNNVAHDLRAPQHVRWSAVRWLMRQDATVLDEQTRAGLRSALEKAAALPDAQRNHSAAVNAALVKLDTATQAHLPAQAEAAVTELTRLDPGVIQHLQAAAGTSNQASYIASHYPY